MNSHPFGFRFDSNVVVRNGNYNENRHQASDLEFEVIHDDVKATKKDDALRLAVSQLANEFSEELMLSLQKFFGVRRAQVISTGSLKLDIALGMGRLPKGRIVEIYGRETAGKTTLALQVIKEARKHRAYLDVENALDASLVESIGVNIEKFLVSHPDCAENVLSMVDTLTKSGAVDVIVVDSVAALLPKRELDQLGVSTKLDLQPQLMTQALRKIQYSLSHSQTLIIFVNQVETILLDQFQTLLFEFLFVIYLQFTGFIIPSSYKIVISRQVATQGR
ncbi:DNA repair protein recA homolog 2, mitochondrial-like [Arachis duranensis]|uniref:DNA repair protein recA homolog 2, mitochondrial-like n=1 Tax=Arachis duranensis TaxID=130453 RepID=A0A9C6TCP5_ARADU|nr:DNA repair protein recA homolog 2, mitochondrial-like [Arachis duranensis]